MKNWLCCATLALSGCAYGVDGAVVFDVRGSDATLALAEEAAVEWNQCPSVTVIVGRNNGGIPIEDVPFVTGDRGGETFIRDSGKVDWVKIRTPFKVDNIVAHEIGHVLTGKEHRPSGLMASWLNGTEHVTDAECELALSRTARRK